MLNTGMLEGEPGSRLALQRSLALFDVLSGEGRQADRITVVARSTRRSLCFSSVAKFIPTLLHYRGRTPAWTQVGRGPRASSRWRRRRGHRPTGGVAPMGRLLPPCEVLNDHTTRTTRGGSSRRQGGARQDCEMTAPGLSGSRFTGNGLGQDPQHADPWASAARTRGGSPSCVAAHHFPDVHPRQGAGTDGRVQRDGWRGAQVSARLVAAEPWGRLGDGWGGRQSGVKRWREGSAGRKRGRRCGTAGWRTSRRATSTGQTVYERVGGERDGRLRGRLETLLAFVTSGNPAVAAAHDVEPLPSDRATVLVYATIEAVRMRSPGRPSLAGRTPPPRRGMPSRSYGSSAPSSATDLRRRIHGQADGRLPCTGGFGGAQWASGGSTPFMSY